MVFWHLVDLNKCRVVTDIISLIGQLQFWDSPGPLPGRGWAAAECLVRDNDCLRVKLEDGGLPENLMVYNDGDSHFIPRKAKKRAFKEDKEMELGSKCSKKPWKKKEDSSHLRNPWAWKPNMLQMRPGGQKAGKSRVTGSPAEEEKEVKREEKCEHKKQTKAFKSPRIPAPKKWSPQNCSLPRGSPKGSPRSSLTKAWKKSSMGSKESPGSLSESGSPPESIADDHCNVTVQELTFSEKLSAELLKDRPATKTAAANSQASKPGFTLSSGKGRAARA
ncbi:hypothetical protein STEG23_022304 [Scotinomys teguina]